MLRDPLDQMRLSFAVARSGSLVAGHPDKASHLFVSFLVVVAAKRLHMPRGYGLEPEEGPMPVVSVPLLVPVVVFGAGGWADRGLRAWVVVPVAVVSAVSVPVVSVLVVLGQAP